MHQNEAKLKQKKTKIDFFFFNLLKTWVLVFTLSKKEKFRFGSRFILCIQVKCNFTMSRWNINFFFFFGSND